MLCQAETLNKNTEAVFLKRHVENFVEKVALALNELRVKEKSLIRREKIPTRLSKISENKSVTPKIGTIWQ